MIRFLHSIALLALGVVASVLLSFMPEFDRLGVDADPPEREP